MVEPVSHVVTAVGGLFLSCLPSLFHYVGFSPPECFLPLFQHHQYQQWHTPQTDWLCASAYVCFPAERNRDCVSIETDKMFLFWNRQTWFHRSTTLDVFSRIWFSLKKKKKKVMAALLSSTNTGCSVSHDWHSTNAGRALLTFPMIVRDDANTFSISYNLFADRVRP